MPRPLYGLERLAARPEVRVIITEGEKAADAAGALLPGWVAVTSPGGARLRRRRTRDLASLGLVLPRCDRLTGRPSGKASGDYVTPGNEAEIRGACGAPLTETNGCRACTMNNGLKRNILSLSTFSAS